MGVKLKSLRPAVGSYGNVAANGIVEVDEAEATRLRKTGRFVDATPADITAAQKAQEDHIARAVTGTGVFAPMPEAPRAAEGSIAIRSDRQVDATSVDGTGATAEADGGEPGTITDPRADAGNADDTAGANPDQLVAATSVDSTGATAEADGGGPGTITDPTADAGNAADTAGVNAGQQADAAPGENAGLPTGAAKAETEGKAEPQGEAGKAAAKAGAKPAGKTQ